MKLSARLLGAATLAAAALCFGAPSFAQSSNPADILSATSGEAFTFTFRSAATPDSNVWTFNDSPALEVNAGGKWRFTFDLDAESPDRFAFDSLSAGAFFDVTPRMRLGGALSFSEGADALTRATGRQFDGDVPEVKFESAFKF